MHVIMRSLCIISIWSLHIHAAESKNKNRALPKLYVNAAKGATGEPRLAEYRNRSNQVSHYPGDCIIDLLPKLQEYENRRSKNKPPKPYDMWYCPSPLSSPIPKIEPVAEDEKKACWQDGDLGLRKVVSYLGVRFLDELNGCQQRNPHIGVDTKVPKNQRNDNHRWNIKKNATFRARMQRCRHTKKESKRNVTVSE